MDDLKGTNLGRYALTEKIGRGGMATVYKGYDTQLERPVAIKVLLQHEAHSAQFLTRFKREAKTLAMLSHPNIVKVLDYGDQDGIPFLVMDYVSGGNLAHDVEKPVHWRRAAQLLAPVARALQYVHEVGIIHRDIKPSNILLSETGVPQLSDFGIAKIIQYHETLDLTQPGVGIGTPEYMAPEQATGTVIDFRADIYSLGIVFYELVTGVRPYTADTPLAVLLKQHNQSLPRPALYAPDLPEDVEQFLIKMLSKNPDHRYQTMAEVAQNLDKIAQGVTLSTLVPITAEPVDPEPAVRRRPIWLLPVLVLVALLFVAGTASGAYWLAQSIKARTGAAIPKTGQEAAGGGDFATFSNVTGAVQILTDYGQVIPVVEGTRLQIMAPFSVRAGDGQARINIDNGPTLCILPRTDFKYNYQANRPPGMPGISLALNAGRLLLSDNGSPRSVFAMPEPFGLAITSRNAVIGLERVAGQLGLDCLGGRCRFQGPGGSRDLDKPGFFTLDSSGQFGALSMARRDLWTDTNCGEEIGRVVAGVAITLEPKKAAPPAAAAQLAQTATPILIAQPTLVRIGLKPTATPAPFPLLGWLLGRTNTAAPDNSAVSPAAIQRSVTPTVTPIIIIFEPTWTKTATRTEAPYPPPASRVTTEVPTVVITTPAGAVTTLVVTTPAPIQTTPAPVNITPGAAATTPGSYPPPDAYPPPANYPPPATDTPGPNTIIQPTMGATQPGNTAVQPTDSATLPSNAVTQPADAATQAPQPPDQPTSPANQAANPTDQPSNGTNQTTNPVTQPTANQPPPEPTQPPAQNPPQPPADNQPPAQQPTVEPPAAENPPPEQPSQPAADPAQSGANQAQPAVDQPQPAVEPAQPAADPAQSTTSPN